MNLHGRGVLITGAASGLGAACAERLRQIGATVARFDRRFDPCTAPSEGMIDVQGDVTNEDDVARGLEQLRAVAGGVHGVVQCAGILRGRRLVSRRGPYPLDEFTEVLHVNVVGTFNVIRLAAPIMAEQSPDETGERGLIINTSSVAAFEGQVGQAAYSASKGAVASMTLPLARELGAHGIRVVAIAPGVFDTSMMASLPEALRTKLAAAVPFPPRLGRPDEFAALVQHIFENPMLNGATLRLDGALRMSAE